MNVMRKLTKSVAAWILSISLFLLATFIAVSATVASPNYIKQTLYQTQFYKNIVPAALNLATTSSTSLDSQEQQLTNATIKELTPIIQKVLTPAFLQSTIETVVDETAVWLKGDTKAPAFVIKTDDVKASLNNELSVYIQTRFNGLPVCDAPQNIESLDPLTATCRPNILLSDVDAQSYAQDFTAQLPFLKTNELSLASIDTDNSFATSPVATGAPNGYRTIMLLPYIFAALIVASSVAIIFLSTNHFKAIKTVGHTFLWAGFLLITIGAITLLLSGKFEAGFIGSGNDAQMAFVQTIFTPILARLGNSFAIVSLYLGVAYAVICALCYTASHYLKLRHQKLEKLTQQQPDVKTNLGSV